MLLFVLLDYVPDWNNIQKLGKRKFDLLFLLLYLKVNCIKCTPCFVVCAAGLCSWLEQYRKLGKLKFRLTNFDSIFTTKLHQMHIVFCCLCCWLMFSTKPFYKKLGHLKFHLLFLAMIFATKPQGMLTLFWAFVGGLCFAVVVDLYVAVELLLRYAIHTACISF